MILISTALILIHIHYSNSEYKKRHILYNLCDVMFVFIFSSCHMVYLIYISFVAGRNKEYQADLFADIQITEDNVFHKWKRMRIILYYAENYDPSFFLKSKQIFFSSIVKWQKCLLYNIVALMHLCCIAGETWLVSSCGLYLRVLSLFLLEM